MNSEHLPVLRPGQIPQRPELQFPYPYNGDNDSHLNYKNSGGAEKHLQ